MTTKMEKILIAILVMVCVISAVEVLLFMGVL